MKMHSKKIIFFFDFKLQCALIGERLNVAFYKNRDLFFSRAKNYNFHDRNLSDANISAELI